MFDTSLTQFPTELVRTLNESRTKAQECRLVQALRVDVRNHVGRCNPVAVPDARDTFVPFNSKVRTQPKCNLTHTH